MPFPIGIIALWSGLGALGLWAVSRKPSTGELDPGAPPAPPSVPPSVPVVYTPPTPPAVNLPPVAMPPAPGVSPPASPYPMTPPASNLTPAGKMFDQLGQQATIAMKALGYDSTGTLKPGVATAEAVQAATALAALMEANGLSAQAAQLRAYAKQAADRLSLPECPGVPTVLPLEVQKAVCRAMTLERDPKVLRGLTTVLRGLPVSSDPQVATLVKLLEATAAALEAQQSKADTEAKIAEVLAAKTPGVMPSPIPADKHSPPVLPPEVKALVDAALRGMNVVAGVVKGPVTADALVAARQAIEALTANGQPELAAELRYYLMFAEKMVGAPAVTSSPVPVAPAGARTHQVKAGETGQSIAKLYTGDVNRWRELAKANPKTTSSARGPNVAKWGMVIYPSDLLVLPPGW